MGTVVTGASGYIGSHVVANLLARGASVRATVRDVSDPDRVAHLRALPIAEGVPCNCCCPLPDLGLPHEQVILQVCL